MANKEKDDLNKIIDIGVKRAAAKAQAEHKKAGRPIYVWEDGKVVEVPPDQILVQDDPVNGEQNR